MSNKDQKAATDIALRAFEIANVYKHEMATLEHVLVALLETEDVQTCFKHLTIDIEEISSAMTSFMNSNFIATTNNRAVKSKDFEGLFIRTVGTAQFSQRKTITPIDILLVMAQMPYQDSFAVTALLNSGLTTLAIKRYLSVAISNDDAPDDSHQGAEKKNNSMPKEKKDAIELLAKYTVDLNELARNGGIDPVIGRVAEIDLITQSLARRSKNSVALVGESGVGKTAIVEGLAFNITKRNVPDTLKNSVVYSLDIASLVAGTRFRGDFEERFKQVLKSLEMVENSILFIDEIHTIMNAGSGSNGTLDVANLLKPSLSKGKLRCIGSTTTEEYRQHFEKDRALVRRFRKIIIDEPTPELTKMILRGLRGVYEGFHGVTYTDVALDAAVDLTHRYIQNALLPDKAIDVIDSAGARQRITDVASRNNIIDISEIEREISKIAKIPEQEINENEGEKLERLESDLRESVFGQNKAIGELTDAVFISRAGLRDVNKPAGSYLLAGPTGVGKTESCRQLAQTLGIPLVKFDMSEFMEKHSVSKLIGSPPGYVGYSDGSAGSGLLVNAIDNHPSCVLLLDEIEKAHEDVFNILLQVMDDGRLTSSTGKTVNFRNVYVIMTTNAGVVRTEQNSIGFGSREEIATIDHKAIKALFSPEFRNRLDAIITFERLTTKHIILIVDKFLAELSVLASMRNVRIDVDDESRAWLADKGFDPSMGARPLARTIQEFVKKPLSRLMLVGSLKDGGTATVRLIDGKIVVDGNISASNDIEKDNFVEVQDGIC